jgi:serine/threonine-protein kinase HipA
MSINGRFKDFSRADLLELANRFGIGSAKNVIDEVVTSITSWSSFAAQAGVPKPVADTIGSFHLLELGKV